MSATLTALFCDTLCSCDTSDEWLAVAERLATRSSSGQAALIESLVERAEPGDAHIIGDLALRTELPEGSRLLLGRWLLRYGSAELCSSRHTMTGLRLAALFASQGDAENTRRALSVALKNERAWALGTDDAERLALALGVAMGEGDRHDLLEAVIEKLGGNAPNAFVRALSAASHGLQWSGRVQAVLAAARLRGNAQTPWWLAVMAAGPPVITEIPPACFAAAARALSTIAQGNDFNLHPLPALPADGQLRGWGGLVAAAFALRPERGLPLSDLKMALARRQDVREGASEGFLRALGSSRASELAEQAKKIFARSKGLGAHEAVIHLLTHQEHGHARPSGGHDLDAIRRTLHRLVATSWPGTVGGFDLTPATSWIRSVAIDDLDDESPIAERGDRLVVRRATAEALFDLAIPERERIVLVELFVIHELVHLQQGIGDKATVRTLRGRGLAGETTLMHLDLGADHVAACALAYAKYPDKLLWLKDLQGASLQAFPVGSRHGYGSRYRKSLRLVGLRVDLAARQAGLLGESTSDGAYAFCDIGARSVSCLISGPPMRIVCTAPITDAQQSVLENAAARAADLGLVDGILARLTAPLPQHTEV